MHCMYPAWWGLSSRPGWWRNEKRTVRDLGTEKRWWRLTNYATTQNSRAFSKYSKDRQGLANLSRGSAGELQSFLRRKVWLLIFVHTAQSFVNMQTVTHSQHLHSVHRKPLATPSLIRTGLRHRVLNMALSKSIIHSLRTSSAVNHSHKASMTPHTHTH